MFIIKDIIRGGGMKYLKKLLLILVLLLILIGCSRNKPPNTPVAPSGPSSGVVGQSLSFSAHTTDPDDDDIAYQFEWGDDNLPLWSSYKSSGDSVTQNHIYSSTGNYEIMVKAKDIKDKESEWSPVLQVEIIEANNIPIIPQAPSGPSSGYIDSAYSFKTSTTDPEEDSISYQFDWGDGIYSDWSDYVPSGDSISMNHSYSSEGTYGIKSKAKDEDGDESAWSGGHSIDISIPNRPPTIPLKPSGPDSGYVDSTYSFQASTTDPEGDSVAYQFDWGDGIYSDWSNYAPSGDSVFMDHLYSAEGTYNVKSRAEDEDGNESGWSSGHSITITEISPGDKMWSFSTGGAVISSPAIGDDGTIYIGSGDHYVYAINPDGTEKWTFRTGDVVSSSPAIGSDGTIYIGSCDDKIYAINPDGTEKWAFSTGGIIGYASPAIGSDGTIYIGNYDGNFYAINPDGSEKWTFPTGDSIYTSSAIGSDNTIYILPSDSIFYAINPDGTEKWTFSPIKGLYGSSPAIGSDGTIYIGSGDNHLYAINPDGTEKWAFPAVNIVNSSPAIGSDGTIYVGSTGIVYAINPGGTEKWSFETGDHVPAPPAIGADGTVYVGCNDRLIYAINPDGTEKWTFEMEENTFSCPAIVDKGTIYVGSNDGNLYAICGSSGGLANTPWPMFLHDLKHNGRVQE
jgi:outer membrane protein assembly factor BamB